MISQICTTGRYFPSELFFPRQCPALFAHFHNMGISSVISPDPNNNTPDPPDEGAHHSKSIQDSRDQPSDICRFIGCILLYHSIRHQRQRSNQAPEWYRMENRYHHTNHMPDHDPRTSGTQRELIAADEKASLRHLMTT